MIDHGFRHVPIDPPYGRGYEHERLTDILAMGPKGEKGDKGSAGPAGERGERGPIGPKGEKGDKGDVGEPGPRGPRGDRGPAGLDGADGEKGEQGPIGPAGPAGPKGDRGPDGPRGPQGERGPQGIMGLRGEKGDPGSPGKDGRDGKTPVISAVQASDGYVIIVDGKPVAKVTNGSDAPATDVQINGTSITADGVANILTGNGLYISSGKVAVNHAAKTDITDRSSGTYLRTDNIDYAVKAAMTDGKGAAWTDAEKSTAADRIGLGWKLVKQETTTAASSRFVVPRGYSEYVVSISFPSAPASAANMFTYFGGEQVVASWTAVNMRCVTIRISVLDGMVLAQSTMGASRNPQGSTQLGTLEANASDQSKELAIGFNFPIGTTFKVNARI